VEIWHTLVTLWDQWVRGICPNPDCAWSDNEEATALCTYCEAHERAERRNARARERYWEEGWKEHTKSPGHWH
jgi:hypothetical protein